MILKRAKDLVYVYSNLCLISKKFSNYDRILKIINLSLDEPILETDFFNKNDQRL